MLHEKLFRLPDAPRAAALVSIAALALAVTPSAAAAQGAFGSVVAVVGGEVLVSKPAPGRGPAAIYVYRPASDGSWSIVDRLRVPGDVNGEESFGSSMEMAGGTLLVGAGDPEVKLGGFFFRRDDSGEWTTEARLRFAGSRGVSKSSAGPLGVAAVLSILQPPRRMVALEGDVALVASVGGPAGTDAVHTFRRASGQARWLEGEGLKPSDGRGGDEFGAAVALRDNRAIVGAPRQDGRTGAAYLYIWDTESGSWRQETKLVAEGLESGSRFGASVAFVGDGVLVGAPGSAGSPGSAVLFVLDPRTAQWSEVRGFQPTDGPPGDAFGSTIAVREGELWIGAPGAGEGRGVVHRFVEDPAGEWRAVSLLEALKPESGDRFGATLALGDEVAAVGAPGADHGMGKALAFVRGAGGEWSESVRLGAEAVAPPVTQGEVECRDGQAAGFECHDVDLLALMSVESLGGVRGARLADLWGWTDPETGREYALVSRSDATAFVDITEPTAPVYLGEMPGAWGSRDIKVYRGYAFVTADGAGEHGMQVFNLARLRELEAPPVTFEPDVVYRGIASAHNLVIDTETGFAYAVSANSGGETCGGGLHMVDIREPLQPAFAGCYSDPSEGLIAPGRTHDAQCVIYHGPDEEHRGREICFASNETALSILDVTDKRDVIPLAAARYPGLAYVHQGWLTDDQRTFYLDDELDELEGRTDRTRTLVWDVADLDDPVLVREYTSTTRATDHNLYVRGDRMYQANYQAGLRVLDISDPENPTEIGFFDTTPYEGDPRGFGGAWTAFPFFESGTVIVSSKWEGLFILRPTERVLVP